VYTANFVDNPVIVDGKADDRAFADQTMTMDANWILFDSKRDFALLTHLTVPDELMETPLALIYQDDASLAVEPEQFPGQWPNLGYSLHGWPQPEELRFTVSLYFEDGLEGFAADEFARQRSAVVPVQVNQ
jgi:hypothetical protein